MKIVSNARKLIFRPEVNAPTVTFPEGAKLNEWAVNNKTPSVVVRNGSETEPSWQGVDYETGVVIVNEVPDQVAEMALAAFELGGKTNAALARVLNVLADTGFVDQYTTSLTFVEGKLSPAGRMVDAFTGIVKRDDRDQIECWREGDTFYVHTDGARVIEPDILVRTYRNADGSPIALDSVPEGRPEDLKG